MLIAPKLLAYYFSGVELLNTKADASPFIVVIDYRDHRNRRQMYDRNESKPVVVKV